MSPSLPVLSGREVVRVFETLGWQVARQSGSHIVMVKDGEMAMLSISDHKGGRKRDATKLDPRCRFNGVRIRRENINGGKRCPARIKFPSLFKDKE